MNFKKFALGFLAAMGFMAATACSNVEYGNVGIIFDKYGSSKGVQTTVAQPGTFFLNPLSQELYTFPTTTETVSFGCTTEDENGFIKLQTAGGGTVSVCMATNYSIDEVKVPLFFEKFKSRAAGDKSPTDTVAKTYFKQRLKDEMNRAAKAYSPFEMLLNQDKVLQASLGVLRPEFEAFGFNIESVSYTSPLAFPTAVQTSIDATLASTQAAEKAKQDLITVEAQNKIEILNNEKDNTIKLQDAEADAKSMDVRGDAIRRNPAVLDQLAIEAWKSGGAQVPMVIGSAGQMPFIQLPVKK